MDPYKKDSSTGQGCWGGGHNNLLASLLTLRLLAKATLLAAGMLPLFI
jgi:hypothetical protein